MTVKIRAEVDVELTPRQLAAALCDLSDDDQAQVFIEAAKISAGWGALWSVQWFNAGRHLRTCECSTDDARELVGMLAAGAGLP